MGPRGCPAIARIKAGRPRRGRERILGAKVRRPFPGRRPRPGLPAGALPGRAERRSGGGGRSAPSLPPIAGAGRRPSAGAPRYDRQGAAAGRGAGGRTAATAVDRAGPLVPVGPPAGPGGSSARSALLGVDAPARMPYLLDAKEGRPAHSVPRRRASRSRCRSAAGLRMPCDRQRARIALLDLGAPTDRRQDCRAPRSPRPRHFAPWCMAGRSPKTAVRPDRHGRGTGSPRQGCAPSPARRLRNPSRHAIRQLSGLTAVYGQKLAWLTAAWVKELTWLTAAWVIGLTDLTTFHPQLLPYIPSIQA